MQLGKAANHCLPQHIKAQGLNCGMLWQIIRNLHMRDFISGFRIIVKIVKAIHCQPRKKKIQGEKTSFSPHD